MTSNSQALALHLVLIAVCTVELRAEDPEIISLLPLAANPGSVFQMEVRGRSLEGAYGVWFDCDRIKGSVLQIEEIDLDPEKKKEVEQSEKSLGHRVLLEVRVGPNAEVGTHLLRLFSHSGLSNSLWLHIHTEKVIDEGPRRPLQKPNEGQHVELPVVINGKLGEKGQVDYYAFDVLEGQKILFQLFPGTWPGRRTPLLALYEPRGSWFDSDRLSRLAPSAPLPPAIYEGDTVLYIPSLTYDFNSSGTFFVESGVAVGGGGQDYSYQLRIVPVDRSAAPESAKWPMPAHRQLSLWQEREFRRTIGSDRLRGVWSRTVSAPSKRELRKSEKGGQSRVAALISDEGRSDDYQVDPRTSRTTLFLFSEKELDQAAEALVEIALPAIIEGVIQTPGDVDSFRFQVETGQRLALEMETPKEAPPRFNPQISVLDAAGEEVFTNVYKNIGGDGDDWVKTVEPKTIYTFEKGGEYRLQIRDLTSRYGESGFVYRLLIRAQIPHVGEVKVAEDQINLEVGQATKMTVVAEQEEGFDGQIAVKVGNLPPGIQALPAVEAEEKIPPPLGSLHPDRFRPRSEKVFIMLLAAADTPVSNAPHMADITVRPIVEGKPGDPVFVQKLPLMVIGAPSEKNDSK